ncbi:tyrosyl-DNA phosphodiesterase-domain-containing protein [Xylariomycetidae sp. FL0641]|nr:tyrosyl-DNA phosphodiesterase-domain-containing protein [Xylariomycetidae sp. FL0641]
MDGHDPFDGDEDAALRHAIAMSLEEAGLPAAPASENGTAPALPIELSDDDEDDLDQGPRCPPTPKKATKSHAAADEEKQKFEDSSGTGAGISSQPSQPTPGSGLAGLGLDRKRMEEERLARLAAKRKASGPDLDTQRPQQRSRLGRETNSQSRHPFPDESGKSVSQSSAAYQGLPFSRGVVKKTWARGYPRKDDITIEEVLQKDQLELAVLSSFQWDDDWLLQKVNIGKTKLVCIAFATSEAHKEEMRTNVPKDSIRFCFPPMMPAGSMHSKLQLLKFPTYLRIAIPSGNLVPYDWGETGIMENHVFLIDLPRTREPGTKTTWQPTPFYEELLYFLGAQGLDDKLLGSLANYDFTATNQYRFVHTIGQTHVQEWQRTGYCGLGRAVASLGLQTREKITVDCVVASLGSVNMDLVSAIYNAAQGDDGMKEYNRRTTKDKKSQQSKESASSFRDRFRIYFPSVDTVSQSRGGKRGAGTICLQSKWFNAPSFPRQLVHDCESVRKGLLMHSKIMFVCRSGANDPQASWAYVGSANLSESAWGRLVKDKTTGKPKLNCRNWECGVLVPASTRETAEHAPRTSLSGFGKSVPVPMVVPSENYGANESKKPWLFLES